MPASRRLAVVLAVLVGLGGVVIGYVAPNGGGPPPLPANDTVVSGPLSA
jgi:hypothetical protein